MTTILLICDDEKRRAELHNTLIPEFQVYSANHFSANIIKNKLKEIEYIVVETESLGELRNKEKISIYVNKDKKKEDLHDIIKNLLKYLRNIILL